MLGGRTYCRLTVLAPRNRVDVAVPVDVPVAELVPMLLELVGEPAGAGRPLPWRLSWASGGVLPGAATLTQLEILDGELLRLAPAAPPPVAPVFDDPVDAVAAAVGPTASDRRFAACVLVVLATAAAALLAMGGLVKALGTAGPGEATLPGLGAAAALCWAARLSRPRQAIADMAVACAVAAVPLGAAAAWIASAGAAAVTAVAVVVTAALGQMALRAVAAAVVAVDTIALLAVAGSAAVLLGASPTAAATGAAALGLTLGPLLPRAAGRLARLPLPVVPPAGADLPPAELTARAHHARAYLAGLVTGTTSVAAAGSVIAAASGGWAGPTFAAVVLAALALRARAYADPWPARASMIAALAGAITVATCAASDPRHTVLASGVLLALAALPALPRPGSPVVRRAVDLVEGLLVAAAIPLALAVLDVYALVRAL